jgi:hypothetical protein
MKWLSVLPKRRTLLLWDDDWPGLTFVARGLLSRIGRVKRFFRLHCESSYGQHLDVRLAKIEEPRKLLLVAHAERGSFLAKNTTGFEPLAKDWWGGHDKAVGVYALGCGSIECFAEYGLAARVETYLGYRDEVNFFVGTRHARKAAESLLGLLGERLLRADKLDEAFKEGAMEDYTNVMAAIGARSHRAGGDRLSLIFLEEQLQSLELLRGGIDVA